MKTVLAASVIAVVIAAPVLADWDTGDPHKMHFPQMPDEQTGVDVAAGPCPQEGVPEVVGFFLADDFQCAGSGPITDIHIWSSSSVLWINLAIYADIPAGQSGTGYSMPGDVLWHASMAPTTSRVWAQADEEFIDPRTGEILYTNTDIWQLNFLIDEADAFLQDEGQIYWLGVGQSFDTDGNGEIDVQDLGYWADGPNFGWKSSADPWNDDAVYTELLPPEVGPFTWGDGGGGAYGPGGETWDELRYPSWHEHAGESLDLAFVITPEPGALVLLALGGAALVRRRR